MKKAAKRLVLQLNSHYGQMTKESVMKFIDGDISFDFDSFELPTATMIFTKLDEQAFQIPTNPNFTPNANPIFTPIFDEADATTSEEFKINCNNLQTATSSKYILKYGDIYLWCIENEYSMLKKFVDDYFEKNGNYRGVINELFRSFDK